MNRLSGRVLILLFIALNGCASTQRPSTKEGAEAAAARQKTVVASYYASHFAGQRTANGEIFDPNSLSAAHRSLPFGTKVQVRNPQTGKEVIVRINDRGPKVKGREIDLSPRAAEILGMKKSGTLSVEITVLS